MARFQKVATGGELAGLEPQPIAVGPVSGSPFASTAVLGIQHLVGQLGSELVLGQGGPQGQVVAGPAAGHGVAPAISRLSGGLPGRIHDLVASGDGPGQPPPGRLVQGRPGKAASDTGTYPAQGGDEGVVGVGSAAEPLGHGLAQHLEEPELLGRLAGRGWENAGSGCW